MKKQTISKLATLMKVKTQIEKQRYNVVRRRREDALAQADDLKARALAMTPDGVSKASPGDMAQNERYVSRLFTSAQEKRRSADRLESDIATERSRVRDALKRELVSEDLRRQAEARALKARNETEERQRDPSGLIKAHRRPGPAKVL